MGGCCLLCCCVVVVDGGRCPDLALVIVSKISIKSSTKTYLRLETRCILSCLSGSGDGGLGAAHGGVVLLLLLLLLLMVVVAVLIWCW